MHDSNEKRSGSVTETRGITIWKQIFHYLTFSAGVNKTARRESRIDVCFITQCGVTAIVQYRGGAMQKKKRPPDTLA